jgi:hypothetical protein
MDDRFEQRCHYLGCEQEHAEYRMPAPLPLCPTHRLQVVDALERPDEYELQQFNAGHRQTIILVRRPGHERR